MNKVYLILTFVFYVWLAACTHPGADNQASNHQSHAGKAGDQHSHQTSGQQQQQDHGTSDPEHQHEPEIQAPQDHTSESDPDTDDPAHGSGASHNHTESGGHEHEAPYHVETIHATTFHEVTRTSGELLSMRKDESVLVAPASGIVELADAGILEGRQVQGRQVLFRISGNGVAEGNPSVKLKKAKAVFEQSRSDYERAAELYVDKLITQKEYLQHKTQYTNARVEYETLKDHFSDGLGAVRSPNQGWIRDVFVGEGDYVQAGDKMATVIRKDKMLLKAEVSQQHASRLNDIVGAKFQTPRGQIYTTESLNGRVLSRGKAMSEQSHYIPVYFEIDGHSDLIPGSFVNVFLLGREKKDVIALPREAFIEEQGNYFVFVEQDGEFVKRPVVPGITDGEAMLVRQGLQPGEQVVTHGAYQVKLSQTSSSLPHGHSH